MFNFDMWRLNIITAIQQKSALNTCWQNVTLMLQRLFFVPIIPLNVPGCYGKHTRLTNKLKNFVYLRKKTISRLEEQNISALFIQFGLNKD